MQDEQPSDEPRGARPPGNIPWGAIAIGLALFALLIVAGSFK